MQWDGLDEPVPRDVDFGQGLINTVRLLMVFLGYEYAGDDVGTTMDEYLGYLIFILWVVAFWALAFNNL